MLHVSLEKIFGPTKIVEYSLGKIFGPTKIVEYSSVLSLYSFLFQPSLKKERILSDHYCRNQSPLSVTNKYHSYFQHVELELHGDTDQLCVANMASDDHQVWTGDQWSRDATLTIGCIDPDHGVVDDKKETAVESYDVGRTELGKCCQEVRVSSLDIGQEYQGSRMTVYRCEHDTDDQ